MSLLPAAQWSRIVYKQSTNVVYCDVWFNIVMGYDKVSIHVGRW